MKNENLRAGRSFPSFIQTLETVIVWAGFWSGLTEAGHEARGITKEQDVPEGQVHKMGKEGSWTWCVTLRKSLFTSSLQSAWFWEPIWAQVSWEGRYTSYNSTRTVENTWNCRLNLGVFHLWIVQHSFIQTGIIHWLQTTFYSIKILFVAFANLPWKITSEIKCNADSLWKPWWMSCRL